MTASESSTTSGSAVPLTPEQVELIRAADELFEKMCHQRYEMGKEQYGAFTFLNMPTLEMAMEEVIDLANYARFTFIKLVMLSNAIDEAQQLAMIQNRGGFMPNSSLLGGKDWTSRS